MIGEANFSDHGANRLGASALMQGLADGYFVLPYTIGNYLASAKFGAGRRAASRARGRREARSTTGSARLLAVGGTRTVDHFHRELGQHPVGELRHGPERPRGSVTALARIPELRDEFWGIVEVLGHGESSTSRSRRRAGWPTSSSSPS